MSHGGFEPRLRGGSWARARMAVLAAAVACASCGEADHRAGDPATGVGGSAGALSSSGGAISNSGGATSLTSGGTPSTATGGGAATGGAGGAGTIGNGGAPTGGSGGTSTGGTAGAPAQTAGSSGMAGATAGAGGAVSTSGKLPPVTSTSNAGPFATTQDLATGPKGQSGLFRPKELGMDGLRHPVFVWGCGGTATPSSYATELNLIASHGFVVIAEVENIGDNGAPLLAAADWIVAENARSGSALFQKLDTSKLGLGGHSIGSVNSFIAGTDARWTTTIHVAGGSLDNVNDPNAPTTGKGGKSLVHPVAYICAENDVFGNVQKTQKDYDNTTVPAFFTIIAGADHVGAVTAGLPAIVAWLRWQLGGEVDRRSSFLDPKGEFETGKYSSHVKNW